MADNYTVKDGSNTNLTIRAKDISGAYSPRVIPQIADADVSTANPIPISDAGGSITVDGPLTDTQLRATAVPVSGPLTDTELRATAVPVSGPVTNTELRAAPVVVNSSQQTDTMYSGTTALTPKFAAISAASSGNNTIVAAVTGKKIRVLSYSLVVTSAVTAQWKSATGGANLSGAMPFGANGGISAPHSPVGHFETASGELLNLVLGSAVAVAGHVTYVEV